MDHDHGDTGTTADTKSCPMKMIFHARHCERILWSGWLAYTVTEFVFSALAIFVMSFAYEGIKFYREYLIRKSQKSENERLLALQTKNSNSNEGSCSNSPLQVPTQPTYMQRIFSTPHIVQTLLNIIQIVISYLLMLIFMLCNYWLCLAVILGLGFGYFCFGWIKQEVYDSDCCH